MDFRDLNKETPHLVFHRPIGVAENGDAALEFGSKLTTIERL
jgi:hypothetical protein